MSQAPIDVNRQPAPIHPPNDVLPTGKNPQPWGEKPQPWPGGGSAEGGAVSGP